MEHFATISMFLLCAPGLCASLKIGAFNPQIFGQTKFSNSDVVSILGQVCSYLVDLTVQQVHNQTKQLCAPVSG